MKLSTCWGCGTPDSGKPQTIILGKAGNQSFMPVELCDTCCVNPVSEEIAQRIFQSLNKMLG